MDCGRTDGMILVLALLLTLMLSVLAAAFTLVTSAELLIAANFRDGLQAQHGAEAASERAIADLAALVDWSLALDGTARSTFGGGSSAEPVLLDGSLLDLGEVTNLANCHKVTPCSAAEMAVQTTDRPWGASNPRWQVFLHGRVGDLAPSDNEASAASLSAYYAVVFVAADPSRTLGEPLSEEKATLVLRSQVFGPRGTSRTIESRVSRTSGGRIRLVGWHSY